MRIHYSILAQRIPWKRSLEGYTVHRVAKSWTQLKQLSTQHTEFPTVKDHGNMQQNEAFIITDPWMAMMMSRDNLLACHRQLAWLRCSIWLFFSPGVSLLPKEESEYLTEIVKDSYGRQFSSGAQSCLAVCDPMNRSTPGRPVHHQLLESTQTHVHWVSDAIQPSHPLSSPSPPAFNLSQHEGLFKWVSSLHQVAKVLEFQLQHQSFQWTLRIDLL